MVASSFVSMRAAVAVLLLVCSTSSSTANSLAVAADAVPARELVADVSSFTALDPLATLPLEVNTDAAMAPPVSVSIVAPETTGIAKLTTIDSAPASTAAATSIVMTPVVAKLTPSPSLARQNAAVAMQLESEVSIPTAASTTASGTDTNSGSSTSVTRATNLKISTTTTTKKPTKAPAHVSGSGSGSSSAESSSKSSDGSYESGSGSNRTYACACSNLRKVSLMGLADYCLAKTAVIGNKCGNKNVAENGECPRHGAMPCSDTGYVLTKDSLCLFDESDSVYKCVMSAEDLEIKKNGGKRKTKKSSTASNATNSSDSLVKSNAALLRRASPALHVITLVASIVLFVCA